MEPVRHIDPPDTLANRVAVNTKIIDAHTLQEITNSQASVEVNSNQWIEGVEPFNLKNFVAQQFVSDVFSNPMIWILDILMELFDE